MEQSIRTDPDRLRRFVAGHPLLARLAAESSPTRPIYLVGGGVRDALTGGALFDIDLVVERDAAELGLSLAHDALTHERFGTAELEVEGHRMDIATARRESYAEPGALPEVEFPATIEEDMARRDFTINAMAIPLHEPGRLIDPHGGIADLEEGILRVLHDRSFADDPTRALRAARYAARFGHQLDPQTAKLLSACDLGTVSRERVEHEIELMAAEPSGIDALRLAVEWDLLDLPAERTDLAERAVGLLEDETWRGRASRSEAVLEAISGQTRELPVEPPKSPYEGLTRARGLRPAELLLNRARGAEWLDEYVNDWSQAKLAIGGDDLVLAGIPQGPAIGAGLAAALEAKLNRGIEGVEPELAVAVEAAEAALRDG